MVFFIMGTILLNHHEKRQVPWRFFNLILAGGAGIEPTLMDPESTVLPLDDPPFHPAKFTLGLSPKLRG